MSSISEQQVQDMHVSIAVLERRKKVQRRLCRVLGLPVTMSVSMRHLAMTVEDEPDVLTNTRAVVLRCMGELMETVEDHARYTPPCVGGALVLLEHMSREHTTGIWEDEQ